MKRVAVIGTGYVGLVTGTLLSEFGNQVICVDENRDKIRQLEQNICPIYEPGLSEIIVKNRDLKRLHFSTNLKEAMEQSDVIFITVGTPPQEDGSADLSYIYSVAQEIGSYMSEYKVIVDKSTVPIGTGKKVRNVILKELERRKMGNIEFDMVSNPEFLREGNAVYDFKHPDRIVLGAESKKAVDIMKDIYNVLYLNHSVFIECNLETAEMIKYANNSFLATKISYINEIANLCEKVGADARIVANALGKDGRISPKFLHPGPGYGGSCFPKDTRALIQIAREKNEELQVLEAVVRVNEAQKLRMVDKIESTLGNMENKRIAILGITFKPETDDLREAPSIVIIHELIRRGVSHIQICDPEGEKDASCFFGNVYNKLQFFDDEYLAMKGADALVVLTEWSSFRNLNLDIVRDSLRGKYFFDFRNIYDRKVVEKKELVYVGVGV